LAFVVSREQAGLRLDRFLRLAVPDVPPRSVRAALAAGRAWVNGVRAVKGTALRENDLVTVEGLAEESDWVPAPCAVPGVSVLYRDEGVIVLEKPAGVHTEARCPGEKGTLAGHLLMLCPAAASFAGGGSASLVSRLDRETSGAVLGALTAEAFGFLRAEQAAGRIRKTYACVVEGRLAERLTLSFPIESRGGSRVRVKTGERDPDPGRWTVAEPVAAGRGLTLVRVEIVKGRRHQIRAHLAAAGFPVAGDVVYGASRASSVPRLMLHAEAVHFRHPGSGAPVRVVSPLPALFRACLQREV